MRPISERAGGGVQTCNVVMGEKSLDTSIQGRSIATQWNVTVEWSHIRIKPPGGANLYNLCTCGLHGGTPLFKGHIS